MALQKLEPKIEDYGDINQYNFELNLTKGIEKCESSQKNQTLMFILIPIGVMILILIGSFWLFWDFYGKWNIFKLYKLRLFSCLFPTEMSQLITDVFITDSFFDQILQDKLMKNIKTTLMNGHNYRKFDVMTHDNDYTGENRPSGLKNLMGLCKRSILIVTQNFFHSINMKNGQLCINLMIDMANIEGANK